MSRKFSSEHINNLKKAQKKRLENKKLREKQSTINKIRRETESTKERKKYTPNRVNKYTLQYIRNLRGKLIPLL